MHDEQIMLESRALRASLVQRTEVLDKIKALELLPDGLHLTTEAVAAYFVVHRDTVKSIVRRHRQELIDNGLRVLRGSDLATFERVNVSLSKESYPQGRAHLTVYTRRTVLNIAMLLRDSAVARQVRTYLLDAEERGREPAGALERRVTNIERAMADVGPALRDLGHLIHRMSIRLEHVERRVDNTDRVVCAMSERLTDLTAKIERKPLQS